METFEDNTGIKSLGARWLFHQGASTVLAVLMLVLIAYGAFRVAPEIVRQFQEAQAATLRQVQDSERENTANLSRIAEKFDREQERTFQYFAGQRDARASRTN
jgi:hypothetical protein